MMAEMETLVGKLRQLPRRVRLTNRSVTEIILRELKFHEGHWRIVPLFGPAVPINANIHDQMYPAAMVPIVEIALVREDEENPLTVDANEVNPKSLVVLN